MSNEKPNFDKSYDEIWREWNDKYTFGAKGEMSLSEAKDVHNKWKRLGTAARNGTI